MRSISRPGTAWLTNYTITVHNVLSYTTFIGLIIMKYTYRCVTSSLPIPAGYQELRKHVISSGTTLTLHHCMLESFVKQEGTCCCCHHIQCLDSHENQTNIVSAFHANRTNSVCSFLTSFLKFLGIPGFLLARPFNSFLFNLRTVSPNSKTPLLAFTSNTT